MEIVEKKLSELVPYENNPKHHPDEQIDKIAKSITEFGFKVPLVIGEDNEIAAEQLDRACYMMELDEHYCDVIVRRYIDYKKNKEEEFSIKINGNDVSEDVFRE